SVRMLSEGYEMSGSRSTERRLAANRANTTTPRESMNTATGRGTQPTTSFMASPWGLMLDRGFDGPLLQGAPPGTEAGVALGARRQHLRRVPGGGAELDERLRHRVAVGHEDVVLSVLFQHRAARHYQHGLEASGAQPQAREVAGPEHTLRIVPLEGDLDG